MVQFTGVACSSSFGPFISNVINSRCLLLLGVLAALCCSSLLFVAPRCSSLLFGIMCLRILQPFRRDRLFYSSFGFLLIAPFSTAMDIKIQALQRAAEVALEKAQKILPRDAELPPQALRCQYRWRLLLGGGFVRSVCFVYAMPCPCESICDVSKGSLFFGEFNKINVCTGIWASPPRTLWAPM